MDAQSTPVDIDVYLHAAGTSVWEAQGRLIRRVEALADRGVVRRASVEVWPRRVCTGGALERTGFHDDALGTIERLSAWAEREGVALPFERGHVVSEFAATDHEVIDTPAVCVAVRVGETLAGVYPHRHPSRCCSVDEVLDRIAREGAGGVTCRAEVRGEAAGPKAPTTEGG
ncbi:MAG: HTH domain-containing protein [Haloferacaceae archaeon]|jgi:hypothetical protein